MSYIIKVDWERLDSSDINPPRYVGPFPDGEAALSWIEEEGQKREQKMDGWELRYMGDPDEVSVCAYAPVWTDEVGTIDVCRTHDNNSRHNTVAEPYAKCISVDPYPEDPKPNE